MLVTLADGTRIACDDDPFAEGGEGRLYWDRAGTYVIKLYKPEIVQNEGESRRREAALQKIISADYSVVLNEPYWDTLFSWPKAIIKQPSLGLTMLRAPAGVMELRWFLGRKQRRVLALQHGPEKLGTWMDNLSLAIQMARVVKRMHFRGLCHSDLSFRNFLADPQTRRVMLIDCDSLVVPGFLPPNILGTPMCMAPELIGTLTSSPSSLLPPSPQTDLHALATLIYWLLFQRHPLLGPKLHDPDPAIDEALALGERALFIEHPTDTSNQIPNLPMPYTVLLTPAVQKLVERAFVQGLHTPTRRPLAADWERFLLRMWDSVVPCANPDCPLKAYILHPGQKAQCPACHTPLQNPSYLPILHFYRPRHGQAGHFFNDRGYVMVGWPERALYAWHADPVCAPGPGVDVGRKAVLKWHRNTWYIENLDLPEARVLSSTGGHQVLRPGGDAAPLSNGARLLLGPPDQCRLAYVEMLRV
ncbi:MAG: hypothetical protein JXA33_14290 [Anaerolineae bacterium]|nr:hypothetical protein [Anaerolineae bacterium]